MKLAEALVQRATLQKRLHELRERIGKSALVKEGNEPVEDANALLRQAERLIDQMTTLVKQINDTNSVSRLADGRTLTHALAERDALATRARLYRSAAEAGTPQMNRYSNTEIRSISTVDVAALRQRADETAVAYRELDTLIQAANWTVDLIE